MEFGFFWFDGLVRLLVYLRNKLIDYDRLNKRDLL